jgi:hypothetical protein
MIERSEIIHLAGLSMSRRRGGEHVKMILLFVNFSHQRLGTSALG